MTAMTRDARNARRTALRRARNLATSARLQLSLARGYLRLVRHALAQSVSEEVQRAATGAWMRRALVDEALDFLLRAHVTHENARSLLRAAAKLRRQ